MNKDDPPRIPRSFRETLDFLNNSDQLLKISKEVKTTYEIAAIQKALDNGPAFLFENIKDFSGVRNAGNILARREVMSAIFGIPDHRLLKYKCLQAIKSPLPPRMVASGPCQEVVITDDLDIAETLPMIVHSEDDAGPVLGGGMVLYLDPSHKESEISFKRMFFRGRDWGSMNIYPGTHMGNILSERFKKGERVPVTINIGVSPAVMIAGGANAIYTVIRSGADELAIAGALQETPVEICPAKTVDAYAIANSEWVIEGYCLPERVFETDEAEKLGKDSSAPFYPEWLGYLGKARKNPKFQITAITHRSDSPIFYTPLAASFEAEHIAKPVREACLFELAENITPGLIKDVNVPYGFRISSGVVYQVKKRNKADDSLLKNLLNGVLGISMSRLIIAVDDDVDIYNADDILWAITTRLNTGKGIIYAPAGSASVGYLLAEYDSRTGTGGREGLVLDTTAPFASRRTFKRAHYPSDSIDLDRFLPEDEVRRIRLEQFEYARLLAAIGG